MAAHQHFKLGRLHRTYDPRIPHLSAMLTGQTLAAPPAAVDYTKNMPANLGMMLKIDGQFDAALNAYDKALARAPGDRQHAELEGGEEPELSWPGRHPAYARPRRERRGVSLGTPGRTTLDLRLLGNHRRPHVLHPFQPVHRAVRLHRHASHVAALSLQVARRSHEGPRRPQARDKVG